MRPANKHVRKGPAKPTRQAHMTLKDADISKRAEAAPKQKLEDLRRLATVVRDSNDAVIMHDFDGKILAWNRGARESYGYTEAEAIGKNVREIVAEPDREAALTLIQKIQQGEIVKSFELRRLAKDGRILDVWLTTTLLRDETGKPVAIATTERDISERKQAEQEIESLSRFPAENPNPILRVGHDGQIIYANPPSNSLLRLWNCTVGEYLPPDWRDRIVNTSGNRGNTTVEVECEGAVYSILIVPIPDPGYVNLYARDITERKRAEEALRESEKKLRTLFAGMTDVVIVYDEDGRYLEIAPTQSVNLGHIASEMLGKTVSDLFPPDEARFFLDHIRQTLKTGQLGNAEYRIRFGEQDRWFSATVSLLSSDSVIWVAHDITNRKSAEDKVQRQLEQLTALSEIDRTIASTLDLRISLSTLLTHLVKEPVIDAADVLVLDPVSQLLEYAAGIGFRTNALQHTHLPLGQGYAGVAGLERRTIHVANLRSDTTDTAFARTFITEDFETYFGLPLIAKGELLGVLEVFRRTPLEPDPEWLEFLNTLAGQAAIAIENATLFENFQRSNLELTLAYDATIEGWSHALDLRDKETEGHTQRVTEMTVNLARTFGLGEPELMQVRWGALLHDIGKMGVPDAILLKPGPLSDEEWLMMKRHPDFAYEMLSPIRYLRLALDIPYCHHEKWDGSGYPRGLKGDQIPLVARIFAVEDVWDALTSDRPYRKAWTKEKARQYIVNESGIHFDPQVVKVFFLEHR